MLLLSIKVVSAQPGYYNNGRNYHLIDRTYRVRNFRPASVTNNNNRRMVTFPRYWAERIQWEEMLEQRKRVAFKSYLYSQ